MDDGMRERAGQPTAPARDTANRIQQDLFVQLQALSPLVLTPQVLALVDGPSSAQMQGAKVNHRSRGHQLLPHKNKHIQSHAQAEVPTTWSGEPRPHCRKHTHTCLLPCKATRACPPQCKAIHSTGNGLRHTGRSLQWQGGGPSKRVGGQSKTGPYTGAQYRPRASAMQHPPAVRAPTGAVSENRP